MKLRLLSWDRRRSKGVTDPNAIGERGGAGSSKDGERRTDRERASDAGCPRGSEGVPQDKGRTAVRGRDGGRRTPGPGSEVAEAKRMPGNQGLPENEGEGSRPGGRAPGEKEARITRTEGLRVAPGQREGAECRYLLAHG